MERNDIKQYAELFEAIRKKVSDKEVAIAILQEIGKDKRSQIISDERKEEPASEKQKKFMRDLGIKFPEKISRKEAAVLIDENCRKA